MADAEYRRLAPHPRACETCEKQFTPKINRGRFCGKSCSDKARKPKEIQCVGCGLTVLRIVRGGAADAGLYCSLECCFKQKALLKQARVAQAPAKIKREKPCSGHVRQWKKWLASERASAAKNSLASRPCSVCGQCVGYTFGRGKKFCSNACKRNSDGFREARDAYKRSRKARLKGVKAHHIKPSEIFERDGWRCQMCGIKTPKGLRGKQKPNSPELDHRHPVSKGGEHTRANLQCLCRSCNAWKSDKLIPTQQGLFSGLVEAGGPYEV